MVMKALAKMSPVNTCLYSLLILFGYFLQVAYSTALLHEEYCNGNNNYVDLNHLDGHVWNYVEVKKIRSNDSKNNNGVFMRSEWFFSFCKPLGHQKDFNITDCNDSNGCLVVTATNGSKTAVSFNLDSSRPSSSVFTPGFHPLVLKGKHCEANPVFESSLIIYFFCDTIHGLGQPLKVSSQACLTTFNWPSSAACRGKQQMESHENDHPILTKCYLYDDEGRERNLRNLIAKDGHKVIIPSLVSNNNSSPSNASPSEEIFINICSEVNESCNKAKKTSLGSSGAAACSKKGSQVTVLSDVRKFSMKFDNQSDEVVVKYEGSSNVAGCDGGFDTIVRLKCPGGTGESYYALESRQPFLVDRNECEMIIEWETDFACPVEVYRDDHNSCLIKGIDFTLDLSPLKKNSSFYFLSNISAHDDWYSAASGDERHDIVLNICNGLSSSGNTSQYCGSSEWKTNSVCRRSLATGKTEVIGMISEARLQMADGQVTLTYPSKTQCPYDVKSNYKTVIMFVCDSTANETALQSPIFEYFSDCTYFFTFKTHLVCFPEHHQPPSCSVERNGLLYDLSPLRRKSNESLWRVDSSVLNRTLLKDKKKIGFDEMYLNVCGKIPKVQKLQSICSSLSEDSGACSFDRSRNISQSLGDHVETPYFLGDKLTLDYRKNTAEGRILTRISFSCYPGIIDSSPVLVNITKVGNDTAYLVDWKTGAACPIESYEGSDCLVVDKELGLLLDLNALRKPDMHDYTVVKDRYRYYLNVCGNLSSSPCEGNNIGICQEELVPENSSSSRRSWVIGQSNTNVSYFNGVLKMKYSNGTAYNDPDKTRRSGDIIFVCDDEAVEPRLEMISEHNRTYFFRIYTNKACPHTNNIIPCLWTNGTHSVDLAKLAVVDDNHFHYTMNKETKEMNTYFFNFCRSINPVQIPLRSDLAVKVQLPCRPGTAVCKNNFETSKSMSMGIPDHPPVVLDGKTLSIIYTNGDPCPGNESERMASQIRLRCNPDEGLGEVARVDDSNPCYSIIDFQTEIVCDVFPESSMEHDPPRITSTSTTPRPFPTPKVVIVIPGSGQTSADSNGSSTNSETKVIPSKDSSDESQKKKNYSFFGVFIVALIALLSVSLAFIILINSETRSLITNRIRNYICGKVIPRSNPIHYSQLTTNDLNTDQVAFISVGATTSSSSPYTSTTMSLKETSSFHGLTSSAAAEALKFSGGRKESEDRIPFSSYDDDSNTDLLT